ncbi:MAG TPA: PadR family transcriptional regulator [Candidatus Saccharimonadales bacterium]|nr:PadR family transcriptional regulator [Candidatus Saccharimonadales bacterium]
MAAKDEEEERQQNYGGGPGFWGGMGRQWGHHGGFGRAQFGQRGWLRPAILKLLEEKPMSGMEMINKFYEASHGWWKPSPGSVYPLLETLESEELIRKRGDGRYEVTKKFRGGAGAGGQVDEMMTNMEGTVSYLEELARSDKPKFSAYRKRIEKLTERLSRL